MSILRRIILLVMLLLLPVVFSGCYNKPVRHLTSDVGLVTENKSTRDEVLIYLGEPDAKRQLDDGREEWVYVEERRSEGQVVPLFGLLFSPDAEENVTLVFQDDVVESITFRQSGSHELDWKDEYSWQEEAEKEDSSDSSFFPW